MAMRNGKAITASAYTRGILGGKSKIVTSRLLVMAKATEETSEEFWARQRVLSERHIRGPDPSLTNQERHTTAAGNHHVPRHEQTII
jgi:hypothetical protein